MAGDTGKVTVVQFHPGDDVAQQTHTDDPAGHTHRPATVEVLACAQDPEGQGSEVVSSVSCSPVAPRVPYVVGVLSEGHNDVLASCDPSTHSLHVRGYVFRLCLPNYFHSYPATDFVVLVGRRATHSLV